MDASERLQQFTKLIRAEMIDTRSILLAASAKRVSNVLFGAISSVAATKPNGHHRLHAAARVYGLRSFVVRVCVYVCVMCVPLQRY